ncbi:Uncharacterised protein [Legionella beliardensis]|uniref:Uncharacterized protein n=1 Tax=Legionella beliardensis TaxID=91822 RepID=A0A378I176_9GAMM|nr:Uncharacterised protein [Legionella beliardensis]
MTGCFSKHSRYRSLAASKRGLNLSYLTRSQLLAAGLQGRFDHATKPRGDDNTGKLYKALSNDHFYITKRMSSAKMSSHYTESKLKSSLK